MPDPNVDYPVNIVAQRDEQPDSWAVSFATLPGTTREDASERSGRHYDRLETVFGYGSVADAEIVRR